MPNHAGERGQNKPSTLGKVGIERIKIDACGLETQERDHLKNKLPDTQIDTVA